MGVMQDALIKIRADSALSPSLQLSPSQGTSVLQFPNSSEIGRVRDKQVSAVRSTTSKVIPR
ncbi:hypothetical protein CFAM422_006232 [Trichoderma lentiforme]|uniref:Uncharacterized protein n=1 Tax=Trichoderma lentiforme TaxID=1567552 RepID=A0A9P4XFT2_9HYPO|nr:hypothetical protein CFAM422_006232 [Trichoderma lentiforme]